MNAVALAFLFSLVSTPAIAALGECGQPLSDGTRPRAKDCLLILRVVAGSETCAPQCICDIDGIVGATASDALACLKRAVGEDVDFSCECFHQPSGDELQLNAYTTNDQARPRVAPGGDGEFIVAWESDGSSESDTSLTSIQVQRFGADGQPIGAQFQANTLTLALQGEASVAADADGNFVVCWSSTGASASDNDASVRARLFDRNGVAIGDEFQVNTYTPGRQSRPDVGMDSVGSFVVVWESEGSSGSDSSGTSIQGQRYDESGALVGTEFQANVITSADQTSPAVAVAPDGRFVAVWSSEPPFASTPTSIRGRRFDENGVPAVGEVYVSRARFAERSDPDVAFDSSGGFVVAYSSYNYYRCGYHTYLIEARRFERDGTPKEEDFIVNECTTSLEEKASVAALTTGGFVVTWQARRPLTTGFDVFARTVHADGDLVGDPVQVNTYSTARQMFADVARGGDGSFLVVWQSDGSGGNDSSGASINGQRFDALEP